MNKIILALICVLPLFGCQSRDDASQTQGGAVAAGHKEAGRKLLAEGITLLEQKNVAAAVPTLEASIKEDPSNVDGYLLLGQILLKAEQFDRAADFMDQAAKIFPDNGTVFYMLSVSNRMAGNKLPAVLAARRSYDIFKAANDTENAQKSAMLLQEVIATPDVVPASADAPVKK